jgi:hypothetical protein
LRRLATLKVYTETYIRRGSSMWAFCAWRSELDSGHAAIHVGLKHRPCVLRPTAPRAVAECSCRGACPARPTAAPVPRPCTAGRPRPHCERSAAPVGAGSNDATVIDLRLSPLSFSCRVRACCPTSSRAPSRSPCSDA